MNFSLQEIDAETNWLERMLMLFRNPMNERKVLLLLEGITDLAFFRIYKNNDSIIYESPRSGKPDVIKAVKDLRIRGLNKVYGICDADFDHIQGISYENIYFTDFHDLEMMLVEGGAVDKFIDNFTDFEKIASQPVHLLKSHLKKSIMDACYKIGLLKWLNCRDGLNLNFKGMDHSLFITVDEFSVDINIDEVIEMVMTRSGRCNVTAQHILERFTDLMHDDLDDLHICNGHDFMHILLLVYRQGFSSDRNLKFKSVESMMRMAYSHDVFSTTILNGKIESVLAI